MTYRRDGYSAGAVGPVKSFRIPDRPGFSR
jgi:hypothetical protein